MGWNRKGTQQAEMELGARANTLYNGIMDLNTPRHELQQAWTKIMAHRDQLLGMHGVEVTPLVQPIDQQQQQQPKKKGSGPRNTNKLADPNEEGYDFKTKLLKLCLARAGGRGVSVPKDAMKYTTTDAPGGGWVACLTSELLTGGYASTEPVQNKRTAEQAVARLAVIGEFPGELGPDGGKAPTAYKPPGSFASASAEDEARGKKRGQPEPESFNNPKTKLSEGLQALMQKNVVKGDIVYEAKSVQDGSPNEQYVASVSLPTYYQGKVWEGEPAETRRDAEASAASVVLEALADIIAPALEEMREKKAMKEVQQRAEFSAKIEARRAAGLLPPLED